MTLLNTIGAFGGNRRLGPEWEGKKGGEITIVSLVRVGVLKSVRYS